MAITGTERNFHRLIYPFAFAHSTNAINHCNCLGPNCYVTVGAVACNLIGRCVNAVLRGQWRLGRDEIVSPTRSRAAGAIVVARTRFRRTTMAAAPARPAGPLETNASGSRGGHAGALLRIGAPTSGRPIEHRPNNQVRPYAHESACLLFAAARCLRESDPPSR